MMFLALINSWVLILTFFSLDKAITPLSGVLSKNCRILLSVHAFSLWLWQL